jgi:pimeloyl-ACP methyl ester carboxylesterase
MYDDDQEENLETVYEPRRLWQSRMIPVRNMEYHVHVWEPEHPNPSLPLLVLAHGWMDVAASWQFVVDVFSDAFMQGRTIIAHDWRGYGLSRPPCACDTFWFPDFLADLDTLLNHFSPDAPVDLVGHSMGGNITSMYAGVRAERIHRFINLEGFGSPDVPASHAPERLARWMDQLHNQRETDAEMRPYSSVRSVAMRLQKTNRRLPHDKARWLAGHWAAPDPQTGLWSVLADPAHKVTNPYIQRADEWLAYLSAITAPMLNVMAEDTHQNPWNRSGYTPDDYLERLKAVPNCRTTILPDCGHMLHHDQPEAVAKLIEDFVQS